MCQPFAIAVLVGVIWLVSLLYVPQQYELRPNSNDYKAARALFNKEIASLGGRRAYERMGIAIAEMEVEDQHAYAHMFGHELYLVEGEQGIVACDGAFNLGCFHQFLGDAIADMGTSAVQRLYDACSNVIGTHDLCKHGLGHGVLAGVGYTLPNLKQALELCTNVTREHTYSGCIGGAFMEYNMRTIASAEGLQGIRTDADVYAPCTQVQERDRSVCMFWLPQWWYATLSHDTRVPADRNEPFRVMGKRCAAAPHPVSCYEGIGYIAPVIFAYNLDDSRAACDELGDTGSARRYCRGMAALIMHLTFRDPLKDVFLCEGLQGNDLRVCRLYAEHEGDFSFTVPD